MIDAVILFDLDGRIIMANKAAQALFLVREDDLEGKLLSEINIGFEVSHMINNVLKNGNEVFTETNIGPNINTFRVHVAPVKNEQSTIESALAVFHDVTDARNFDQMKSQFVANVSHELRTPLTSIKGFVETLLDGAMENSVTCRRFLSIIDAETDRLTRLIEDLLTLSSIESKELIFRPGLINIQKSIRSVMNILGPQISEKGLHVELIYAQGLPQILADEDLIGQVFINLLDNAIKYTPYNSKIIIRCHRRDTRVVTTITDTGKGISHESISRIFERFYRVDKARCREKGGTGLGLAIVKHIVELHGGEVFVDSEVNQGSTFGVSLLVG